MVVRKKKMTIFLKNMTAFFLNTTAFKKKREGVANDLSPQEMFQSLDSCILQQNPLVHIQQINRWQIA